MILFLVIAAWVSAVVLVYTAPNVMALAGIITGGVLALFLMASMALYLVSHEPTAHTECWQPVPEQTGRVLRDE